MASSSDKKDMPPLPKDIWLLRPCELYQEEYQDCTSIAGRFHQYYVYGKNADCSRWKEDYTNCQKFRTDLDVAALEKVLVHERDRRETRLARARANDVWEYRTEPPPEWHTLPASRPGSSTSQESILSKVQQSQRRQGTVSKTESQSFCVLS